MARTVFRIGLAALAAMLAGRAQAQQFVLPFSQALVPCKGGSGSVISSITTTPVTVCQGAPTRGYATIEANSGTPGTIVAYGTIDGTTPSSSHYNFVLYGGLGWDTSGFGAVPAGPIQLVAASGTVTITAGALQSGIAP